MTKQQKHAYLTDQRRRTAKAKLRKIPLFMPSVSESDTESDTEYDTEHAVYFKSSFNMSNEQIAQLCDLHAYTVSKYVHKYEQQGLEGLTYFGYGTNRSQLEEYTQVRESFCSTCAYY